MNDPVRVGTRQSPLARVQADIVISALRKRWPGIAFIAVPLATAGDRTRSAQGNLDFTDAIDCALEEGTVDLAVHSTKDLPARPPRPVRIVAFPRRVDSRDCLVLRRPGGLRSLLSGATIGSSSPRRRAQLLRSRPDLRVVEVRGNVATRIEFVRRGSVDGVILAVGGLRRLGRAEEINEVLDRRKFIPAPGQGALAVVARRNDRAMARLARPLDDPATRAAVTAERTFSQLMGGDCNIPLGASGIVRGNRLVLWGEVLSPDGRLSVTGERSGLSSAALSLGRQLATELLASGATELLPHSHHR